MEKEPSEAALAAAQELLGPVLFLEKLREALEQQTKVLLEMADTLDALAAKLNLSTGTERLSDQARKEE